MAKIIFEKYTVCVGKGGREMSAFVELANILYSADDVLRRISRWENNQGRNGPKIIVPVPDAGLPDSTRVAASMWGLMLFPSADAREKRLAASYVAAMRDVTHFGGNPGAGPEKWGAELVATRAQMIQIFKFMGMSCKDEAYKQWGKGLLAGKALALVSLINLQNPGKASLSKALYLVENSIRLKTGDKSVSVSNTTLDRIWREFSSVSHLWAAYAHHVDMYKVAAPLSGYTEEQAVGFAYDQFMRDPGPVIATAASLLLHVKDCVPEGKKPGSPVLKEEDAWMPPRGVIPVDRPEIFDPTKLFTGLSESMAQLLESYKKT